MTRNYSCTFSDKSQLLRSGGASDLEFIEAFVLTEPLESLGPLAEAGHVVDSVHTALLHLEVLFQQQAVSVGAARGNKVWLRAGSQADPGVESLHQL